MQETKMQQEKAIILGVHKSDVSDFEFFESIQEIKSLSTTAGLVVIKTYFQKRKNSDRRSYLGKGKLEELIEEIERDDIDYDVLIVNDELSSSQSKTLNALFNIKVIDRTQLILDIFAQRAQSKEGQLQVALAQNEYLLPRLTGHGASLSRLGGGIGTRGPGETKLETNRRYIRNRIHDIKKQLDEIKAHRQRYRDNRSNQQMFQIALVGYTNAGKSSWFNQLTDSDMYQEDLLFATLDPKSKLMSVHDGFQVLLTDTVGFIQQLPTHLIEAFSSTLEEAKYADILVHVVDRSHPNYKGHIQTVMQLLKDLEMDDIPLVTLFNKKDKLTEQVDETIFDAMLVSARDEKDIVRVKSFLSRIIERQMTPFEVYVESDGQILSQLKTQTLIETLEYNENKNQYFVKGFELKDKGTIKRLLQLQKKDEYK